MMANTEDYLITTIDNPYNPWTNWDQWYAYDEIAGYHTCSYLDRVMSTSDQLSDEEYNKEYDEAVDEIIRYDITNKYAKIAQCNAI